MDDAIAVSPSSTAAAAVAAVSKKEPVTASTVTAAVVESRERPFSGPDNELEEEEEEEEEGVVSEEEEEKLKFLVLKILREHFASAPSEILDERGVQEDKDGSALAAAALTEAPNWERIDDGFGVRNVSSEAKHLVLDIVNEHFSKLGERIKVIYRAGQKVVD